LYAEIPGTQHSIDAQWEYVKKRPDLSNTQKAILGKNMSAIIQQVQYEYPLVDLGKTPIDHNILQEFLPEKIEWDDEYEAGRVELAESASGHAEFSNEILPLTVTANTPHTPRRITADSVLLGPLPKKKSVLRAFTEAEKAQLRQPTPSGNSTLPPKWPPKEVVLTAPSKIEGNYQTASATKSRLLWAGNTLPEGALFGPGNLAEHGATWRCEATGADHKDGKTLIHRHNQSTCKKCKGSWKKAPHTLMDFAFKDGTDPADTEWPEGMFKLSARAKRDADGSRGSVAASSAPATKKRKPNAASKSHLRSQIHATSDIDGENVVFFADDVLNTELADDGTP
jgi:hypothetical protein